MTTIGEKIGRALGLAYVGIRRNPALVGAAALWAYETATAGDVLTWQGAVTIAVGFLVRAKVVPAREVVEVFEETEEAVNQGVNGYI